MVRRDNVFIVAGRLALTAGHCEERSDEAIPAASHAHVKRLLRFARNDIFIG
jgi:hypothetical protein